MSRPRAKPLFARLSIRFAAMLALALVPIGIFAALQTRALENEVKSREAAGLTGATLAAAGAETGVIQRAQGLMAAMAQAVPPIADDPAACTALASRIAAAEPSASLVGFIPVSGLMQCSSTGQEFDFSSRPLFEEVLGAKKPYLVVNPNGPVSGASVLGISHPVFDDEGSYLGIVSISLPHMALVQMRSAVPPMEEPTSQLLFFWTFDGDGTLLTANVDLAEAARRVPADRPLASFVGTPGEVFEARSLAGFERIYAVVPVVPDELYLMSSWETSPGSLLRQTSLGAYLPTILMCLAGLAMAAAASERLVTRHVRALYRSISRFAQGDRGLPSLDLRAAPIELRDLGDAYLGMTDSIMHGEAQMEDSVHQKEVLLREVHHRVKNNLQLIASIMNIQIRKTNSAEAKSLLKGLQDRILSLATIHRGLYQTSGMVDVQAAELFSDIVRQIIALSSGGDRHFDVKVEVDDIRLVPDQAVPLSLLLTEALTNAIKHSGGNRHSHARVRVRLKRTGGSDATLEVSNTVEPGTLLAASQVDAMDSGLGTQLLTAFVQQLGGKIEVSETDRDYLIRVSFTVTPLAAAESRSQEAETGAMERNA